MPSISRSWCANSVIFLSLIPEFGVRGFSVTLPHKQAILKHLKECEPLAAEIGAVNTIVVRNDGSLYGCNTDYIGVLRALEKKLRIKREPCANLWRRWIGARRCVRARSCRRRRRNLRQARESGERTGAGRGGEVVPRRALRTEFFDAVLNATPIGMPPRTMKSRLSHPASYTAVSPWI